MALGTYTELLASLTSWLKGSPISDVVEDLVTLTTDEINARLSAALDGGRDIRPMVSRAAVTIDAEYVDLPDSGHALILPVSLEISGLERPWVVTYIDPDTLARMTYDEELAQAEVQALVGSDVPRHYSIVGDQFRFFPAPATSYNGIFTRSVRVPALTEDAPTNWVLTNHHGAYLYGALAQAELFGWNDERVGNIATLFSNACDGIIASYPVPTSNSQRRSDIPAGRSMYDRNLQAGMV